MRPFVYIVLLALAIIVFKAFYWDSRTKETVEETNSTVETVQILPSPPVEPEGNISGMSAPEKVKTKPAYSSMPLERLGDSIADSVKGKF